MTEKQKSFIFILDNLYYVVPIENVVEVLQVTHFIEAAYRITGFIGFNDFRHKLVPVFNIQELIDPSKMQGLRSKIKTVVIISFRDYYFGLLIDKFIESLDFDFVNEDQSAELLKKQNSHRYIEQIINYNGKALAKVCLEELKNFTIENFNQQTSKTDENLLENELLEARKKEEIELFCFTIEKFKFGIPIIDVLEIIEGYTVAPLYRMPSSVRGLINLRGQIIVCFDISESLGLPNRTLHENNKLIILQNDEQDIALCIDNVAKIKRYMPEEIQNVKGILSDTVYTYLSGIIERGNERVLLLSKKSVFDSAILKPFI